MDLVWKQAPDPIPHPDWASIDARVPAGTPDAELHRLYAGLARQWVDGLRDALGGSYRVHAGEDWLLLSHESDRYVGLLLDALARDKRRIQRALEGLVDDAGFGPHVLLLIEDLDDYCAYMAHFDHGDPDALRMLGAGSFIDAGYGHLVIPHRDLGEVEAVAVHELTHALLRDQALPLWLDEGIAVNMEQSITGRLLYPPEPELVGRLVAYWHAHGLDGFWSGHSFGLPDEGSELSYALATHVVSTLGEDWPRFRDFARGADWRDAGDASARAIYGAGLGELMTHLLGDGDWSPGARAL
mgnify:CR=1 FL=1